MFTPVLVPRSTGGLLSGFKMFSFLLLRLLLASLCVLWACQAPGTVNDVSAPFGGDDALTLDDDDDSSGADDNSDFDPPAGFGHLSGDCGVLDVSELAAGKAALFENLIDFGLKVFDESLLGEGGQEVVSDGNLGGSSIYSEAISFEVLDRCESALLLKTEGEIEYQDPGGKKTDLLVEIAGRAVGVSVTRAFHFPPDAPYTEAEAADLLEGKLGDILLSFANASPVDAWERSVLHVIAYDGAYADAIQGAYLALDASIVADTLVVVTVTDGEDAFIY